MKVRILPEVLDYLDELVITLYEKEYFGFKESSKKYVKELFLNIKTTLPIRLHKPAPKYFERYGKDLYYASFKKSNRTIWYAFFTKHRQDEEIIYLVRYVSNNHVTGQFLNSD
ncbi:MAG: hypothetical protein LBU83_00955 [Bacteroidales bacterium]|jgi:hypothetical protein|nr:hypothetical protein [Bacteroidales bacterium]